MSIQIFLKGAEYYFQVPDSQVYVIVIGPGEYIEFGGGEDGGFLE